MWTGSAAGRQDESKLSVPPTTPVAGAPARIQILSASSCASGIGARPFGIAAPGTSASASVALASLRQRKLCFSSPGVTRFIWPAGEKTSTRFW